MTLQMVSSQFQLSWTVPPPPHITTEQPFGAWWFPCDAYTQQEVKGGRHVLFSAGSRRLNIAPTKCSVNNYYYY